jgi:hypothetical protein
LPRNTWKNYKYLKKWLLWISNLFFNFIINWSFGISFQVKEPERIQWLWNLPQCKVLFTPYQQEHKTFFIMSMSTTCSAYEQKHKLIWSNSTCLLLVYFLSIFINTLKIHQVRKISYGCWVYEHSKLHQEYISYFWFIVKEKVLIFLNMFINYSS